MRCVVSVATGPHYVANLERLVSSALLRSNDEKCIFWRNELPAGSPTHAENPYAFKIYAIEEAVRQGATSILWMDSSVVILKPLEPLWELIERKGYWFSRNYGYNNAQFTSDEALRIMDTTRHDAKQVSHVVASCFGLNMRSPVAKQFLEEWKFFASHGAFKGDRGDLSGGNDPDKFYGHRNDQSVASQVCFWMEMDLTDPPDYFAEQGAPQNERTILTLER